VRLRLPARRRCLPPAVTEDPTELFPLPARWDAQSLTGREEDKCKLLTNADLRRCLPAAE